MTSSRRMAASALLSLVVSCAPDWTPRDVDAGSELDASISSAAPTAAMRDAASAPKPGNGLTGNGDGAVPDPGAPKPASAAAATVGGPVTGGFTRSASDLTVSDDGFDTINTVCVDELCATGKLEP